MANLPVPHARNSGILLQSPHGNVGNFEVVIPRTGGGVWHLSRDNDQLPSLPWKGPNFAFGSTFDVRSAALVFSSFGHLELVATEGDRLCHHWRDDGGTLRWQVSTYLPGAAGIVGSPGFTQSSFGTVGNFEVVAPVVGGGLTHWWRNNDQAFTWSQTENFGGPDRFDAAAIIQSNFGDPGHLEVVARTGDHLVHFWSDQPGVWQPPVLIATGVSGSPALIQGTSGARGNFEVVTPLAGGGLGHFWRDNDSPNFHWNAGQQFGSGNVLAVGLVEANLAAGGNLEVVAQLDDHAVHHWRDGLTSAWQSPTIIYTTAVYDPSTMGRSNVAYDTGIAAIHSHLLRTGRVLVFGFADEDEALGETRILDPASGQLGQPPSTPNLFCSGHEFLPDGRLLVTGGHHMDVNSLHTFDPATEVWTQLENMPHGRWYPTCVSLEDGRVLVISGTTVGGPVTDASPVNNTLQIFDPATNVMGPEQPVPAPFSQFDPTGFAPVDLYPLCFMLPDSGRVLVHSRATTRFYDPASGTWDTTQIPAARPYSRTYPAECSAVLLPLLPGAGYRARVLAVGGAGDVTDPFQLHEGIPCTNTVEILDLGASPPAWRHTQSMHFPRVMPDAVLLPDGTVLVLGGSSTGRADMGSDPVFPIELFDPASETWSTLAPKDVPASYHSTALLLPDATVLMAGKDGIYNAPPLHYPEHRGEVFSPPYLFRGPRPTIAAGPDVIGYGQTFSVDTPDAAGIGSAALIRCSSVTHSLNMGQRFVGLDMTARTASQISLVAPPSGRVAPAGHYLLFILNGARVPSVARMVRLQ